MAEEHREEFVQENLNFRYRYLSYVTITINVAHKSKFFEMIGGVIDLPCNRKDTDTVT
jgi:hypothetical protein